MLLQFEHDETHEQRLRFCRSHARKIDNRVAIEQRVIANLFWCENHTVEPVSERV